MGDLDDFPWGQLAPATTRQVAWGSPVPFNDKVADRAPAQAPQAMDAAPGASTDDLADLFGDPSPAATGDDLSDLFGDTTPASAAPAPHTAPVDDLADLFGEAPPAVQSVESASDAPMDAAPSVADGADLGDIFGEAPAPTPVQDRVVPAPPLPPPAVDAAPAAATPVVTAPVVDLDDVRTAGFAPPNPFAVDASAAPQGLLAAQRAAKEAARVTLEPTQQVSESMAALARTERYTRAVELEPWVSKVLSMGVGDTRVQQVLHRMTLTRDPELDRQQRAAYQAVVEPKLADFNIQMPDAAFRDLVFDIAYDETIGIGPLGPLWRDPEVNDIMVSGPSKVTVERRGYGLQLTPVQFRNLEHLKSVARQLGQRSADDRAISSTNPLPTIQLPGARVQFVWEPLAVSHVAISIRKFPALLGMDQLLSFGALTQDMRDFLAASVRARATVLVSGGTSAGKTTFINALSEFIPDSERVITIEDALELQLRNTHVEALVTKEAASADDRVRFGQDDLLKASLRLNPDRIIVGEIRDSKGCAVMLEAANTGHDGTMTTIHANNSKQALHRMTNLLRKADDMPYDVARGEVASAIDVVVQVVAVRGRKFVSEVAAVDATTGEAAVVFAGEFRPGTRGPVFTQVARLDPAWDLTTKMLDAGVDHSRWS